MGATTSYEPSTCPGRSSVVSSAKSPAASKAGESMKLPPSSCEEMSDSTSERSSAPAPQASARKAGRNFGSCSMAALKMCFTCCQRSGVMAFLSTRQRDADSLQLYHPDVARPLRVLVNDPVAQRRPRGITDEGVELRVVGQLLLLMCCARDPVDVPDAVAE